MLDAIELGFHREPDAAIVDRVAVMPTGSWATRAAVPSAANRTQHCPVRGLRMNASVAIILMQSAPASICAFVAASTSGAVSATIPR